MGLNVEKFTKICRTCLSEGPLISISSSTLREGVPVSDVLCNFIPLTDIQNEHLPQQICSSCTNHLNLYYNFKKTCTDNEQLFKTCLDNHLIISNNLEKALKDEEKFDIANHDYSTDDSIPLINRIEPRTERRKVPALKIPKSMKKEKDLDQNYTCKQCNKSFQFKYKLNMHSRVHTKEKPFKCDECNLSFSLKGNLKRHKMRHSGERPYSCPICEKAFIQNTSLQAHVEKHKKLNSQPSFYCKICGRSFVRLVPYNLHMKNLHPDEIKVQIVEESEELETKGQYKCKICERTFDKEMLLKRHELRHGEKKFLCSDCGKGFVRKADLQSHIRVHTGEKPYKCPVCNKSFAHIGSLVTHSLVHSGYKPYNCYICQKSFTQLSHLNVHKRIHSGERPYSCTYCQKTFALKSNLTVHLRTHTGETPFVCSVCGRGFYDSSGLKKHKSSHLNLMESNNGN